jgi:hypothetical protein
MIPAGIRARGLPRHRPAQRLARRPALQLRRLCTPSSALLAAPAWRPRRHRCRVGRGGAGRNKTRAARNGCCAGMVVAAVGRLQGLADGGHRCHRQAGKMLIEWPMLAERLAERPVRRRHFPHAGPHTDCACAGSGSEQSEDNLTLPLSFPELAATRRQEGCRSTESPLLPAALIHRVHSTVKLASTFKSLLNACMY